MEFRPLLSPSLVPSTTRETFAPQKPTSSSRKTLPLLLGGCSRPQPKLEDSSDSVTEDTSGEDPSNTPQSCIMMAQQHLYLQNCMAIQKPIARRRIRLAPVEAARKEEAASREASFTPSQIPPWKLRGGAFEHLLRTAPMLPDTPLDASAGAQAKARPFSLQRRTSGSKRQLFSEAAPTASASAPLPAAPSLALPPTGDRGSPTPAPLQAFESCFLPEIRDRASSPSSTFEFPTRGRRLKLRRNAPEDGFTLSS